MITNSKASVNEITHEDAEEEMKESVEWPQYFVTGEDIDEETFVPAFWQVEGPNGPISYRNPNSRSYPTTMYELAMEGDNKVRRVDREETPWGDEDE